MLATESNRKQLVGSALEALGSGNRIKDPNALLDAPEMLHGDRIEPGRPRYAQEVLDRIKGKGHGQILNHGEWLSGPSDVEFHPVYFRLEPELMPTRKLTSFDGKLDKLKRCASLVESELTASPYYCPHYNFRPANEQGDLLPAASMLKQLDDELDRLPDGWQQILLDNLDGPMIQADFDLLKSTALELIKKFVASKMLPAPVPRELVSAVQEPLSGLEKIGVTCDHIKKALLQDGSAATPDDLRKRFETFLNDRCKGKDASKLRFVVE